MCELLYVRRFKDLLIMCEQLINSTYLISWYLYVEFCFYSS